MRSNLLILVHISRKWLGLKNDCFYRTVVSYPFIYHFFPSLFRYLIRHICSLGLGEEEERESERGGGEGGERERLVCFLSL